ncbi:MAG: DUF4327 family protein [Phormidesmis sp. RL_2_1]|nr:DUF4327 family protein [Phormidesmis sp. RL_2_1]
MLKEARKYSIDAIQDEVRALVTKGSIGRNYQIYSLSQYFDGGEWQEVEQTLTTHDYLLRDSICDLIGKEVWIND